MKSIICLLLAAVSVSGGNSCVCPLDYSPVCGTDLVTYSNKCLLECNRKEEGKHDLKVKRPGACEDGDDITFGALEQSSPNTCACPKTYIPVCGSDRRLYSNDCEFNCAKKQKANLTKESRSFCDKKRFERKTDCHCSGVKRHVCGTDGKTYGSKCELDCANSKRFINVRVAYEGICKNRYRNLRSSDNCSCNRMLLPTCGSDGITYPNPCMFKCSQASNPSLTMVGRGECSKHNRRKRAISNCACPRIYDPVCGSDGKTYSNECMLRCARDNVIKSDLKMLQKGGCQNK